MANIGKMGSAALMGTFLWIGTAHATSAVVKCQEAKLKAQGKLQLCLQKNSAKVLGGKPDAAATCQTKFAAALTKAGTACHYLDNGDGTVSDLNTGVQWEKKDTTCPGPHCDTDTFTWCSGTLPNCTNSADPPDGTAFTTFLYGLNGGTSSDGMSVSGCFAGQCDWRLPTIAELAGILDLTQGNCGGGSGPCIDPTFGPTQAYFYWSATTFAGNPTLAWDVYFFNGTVTSGNKPIVTYVRAVRGGL